MDGKVVSVQTIRGEIGPDKTTENVVVGLEVGGSTGDVVLASVVEGGRAWTSTTPLTEVEVQRKIKFVDLLKRAMDFAGPQISPIYFCALKYLEGRLYLEVREKASEEASSR